MNPDYTHIHRIAVVSDTHGHLPSQLMIAVNHVDLIIHAGDIDRPDILEALNAIAPVLAVQGNMDRGDWADHISPSELTSINGVLFYVLHDIYKLDIDPESIGVKVLISGHTHRPFIEKKGEVIYLNPGSPSQPRGGFTPSFAIITLNDHHVNVELRNI